MSSIDQVYKIIKKEFIQESNQKFLINSVLMFSVLLIIILLFPFARIIVEKEVKNILFWVILYFSALSGFQSIFIKEVDRRTIIHLKVNFTGQSIFWGKSTFNFIIMYLIISFILILFCTLFNFEVLLSPITFGLLLMIVLSLGINGTLLSALMSYSGNNSTLYAIIGFPLIFPIFLVGLNATNDLIITGSISTILWISALCYDVISILISYLVFDYIWEHMT